MSVLPHHNQPIRHLQYARTCRRVPLPPRIYCSTTTTPRRREAELPKKLVIEPKLNSATAVSTADNAVSSRSIFNDPSLQSTWPHRAWVASGCTTVLVSLAKAIAGGVDAHIWVEPLLAGVVGYVLADLGSGVYHWGIDNYGGSETPFFGSQIDAFQGHHKWPWTITRRQFANNLHALARVITFTVLPIDLLCNDAVLHGFVSVFSGCIMFSQQFHAWAHGTKSKLPAMVVSLQDAGILVSRSQHAAHHHPPYNNNYCIVSGVWNEILDSSKIFEVLEMILFFRTGARPRSWSEPNSEWTEESEASSVITQQ